MEATCTSVVLIFLVPHPLFQLVTYILLYLKHPNKIFFFNVVNYILALFLILFSHFEQYTQVLVHLVQWALLPLQIYVI